MNTGKNRKAQGVVMTLTGGILWGLCGSCGQFLFQYKEATSNWLVPIRLMGAGILDFVFTGCKKQKRNTGSMGRTVGKKRYSYFLCIWYDALPVCIFYNDSVFQCGNSNGPAVYGTCHDSGMALYQGTKKAEIV